MDTRVFQTFLQVAQTKHFGHAAENLYITQAAVSARIKQLEEFYKSPLFIRNKNNLKLTAAGEALIPHATKMIAQMEQSIKAVNESKHQKIKFTIAATPNIWDAFFSSRIHHSIKFFEQVFLSTEISVREAIQRKLNEHVLDVGLLTDPIKDEDYNNDLVGHFELALVATSKNHESLNHKYVFVDWGITFKKEHALHHKFQPILSTSTAMIALEVIMSKGGIAYLPLALVAPLIAKGELFIIESPLMIKRPIYMATRKTNNATQLIARYKAFLEQDER